MNKYNARKCVMNGEVYDSKKEMRRHQELLLLEDAGRIKDLRRQVKFVLIPSQREMVLKKGVLKPGKVLERECSYVADFCYEENGQTVVEDVKGCKKGAGYAMFSIKRKLMLHVYGIRVREI